MRIGLQVSAFKWPGGDAQIGTHFANIARTADEAGFASLWVMDHFWQIQMIGPETDPMLEGYTALSFAAGITKQIKLGTLVTGVIYRNPGILVKTVTSLDVLSGGRAYLGIGAAWYEGESKGLGVHFPALKDRFEQLEDTLQIAKQMWAGNAASFSGKQFNLDRTLNVPQALSKPHPPILIGGSGEKKTLRLVAKYADACNLFAMGEESLRQKLDILRAHCQDVGRNYDEIEKTVLAFADVSPSGMSPAQVVDMCRGFAALGISHVIFGVRDVEQLKPLEIIAKEIIPAVASL